MKRIYEWRVQQARSVSHWRSLSARCWDKNRPGVCFAFMDFTILRSIPGRLWDTQPVVCENSVLHSHPKTLIHSRLPLVKCHENLFRGCMQLIWERGEMNTSPWRLLWVRLSVFIFVFLFFFSLQFVPFKLFLSWRKQLWCFGSDVMMAINSFWKHVLSNDVTTEAKLEAIRKTICSVQLYFQAPLALWKNNFHPESPSGQNRVPVIPHVIRP